MDRSKIKVGAKIRYKIVYDDWVDGIVTAAYEDGDIDVRLKDFPVDFRIGPKDLKLEIIN